MWPRLLLGAAATLRVPASSSTTCHSSSTSAPHRAPCAGPSRRLEVLDAAKEAARKRKSGVVYSYVVEDPDTKEITDMVSSCHT